jgi:hypothetical protein
MARPSHTTGVTRHERSFQPEDRTAGGILGAETRRGFGQEEDDHCRQATGRPLLLFRYPHVMRWPEGRTLAVTLLDDVALKVIAQALDGDAAHSTLADHVDLAASDQAADGARVIGE